MKTRSAVFAAAMLAAAWSGDSSPAASAEFYNSAEVLKWMNSYRSKPDPMRAALAIHQLSGFTSPTAWTADGSTASGKIAPVTRNSAPAAASGYDHES